MIRLWLRWGYAALLLAVLSGCSYKKYEYYEELSRTKPPASGAATPLGPKCALVYKKLEVRS